MCSSGDTGRVRRRPFFVGVVVQAYVTQEGWRQARLDRCPLHRRGDCGLARHGSYGRVEPPGMRVARWYCPEGRTSFSLLPDCLASRLSGSLSEVEQVVAIVEEKQAQGKSIESAAATIRPDIELPGALRWVRRRLGAVHRVLLALVTLMPGALGSEARVLPVRSDGAARRPAAAPRPPLSAPASA